jgi:hypothetical protein
MHMRRGSTKHTYTFITNNYLLEAKTIIHKKHGNQGAVAIAHFSTITFVNRRT